jgi:hypothetical protein
MRLRLFRGRIRWPGRDQPGLSDGRADGGQAPGQRSQPQQTVGRAGGVRGTHRKASRIWQRTGPAPTVAQDAGPAFRRGAAQTSTHALAESGRPDHVMPLAKQDAPGRASGAARGLARAAIRIAPDPGGQAAPAGFMASSATARTAGLADAQPWYATARPGTSAAGRRNCGCLEQVLIREWAEAEEPSPEAVTAVNRLAALPLLVKEKLAAGLDAIHVGSGGVPDLDDMGELAGVPLPSGRATWDACAGAYGDRKIVVGSRPSPTPDVMCHEVGHALDDLDGASGQWLSDSDDFRALYARCLPHIASEFHRHGESLGRREFFADAFAAIASSQRPALVEMLSGDTRTALDVMLYFNVRYGM